MVLSYHSGEDRIVKDHFRTAATGGCTCPPGLPCVCGATPTVRLLNRGSRKPSAAEVEANPRSESARLRAVERLPIVETLPMSDTTARQHSPARPPAVTAADSEATRPRGRPDPAAVHLRVVTPPGLSPARRRRRVRLLGVVLGTFVVGVVFALVGLHVMLAQNQFRLDKPQHPSRRRASCLRAISAPDGPARRTGPHREDGGKQARHGPGQLGDSAHALAPADRTTTAATGAAADRTPSTTAVAGDHPPTDWTTVKPLLVPNP